jgi:hypothetical protein
MLVKITMQLRRTLTKLQDALFIQTIKVHSDCERRRTTAYGVVRTSYDVVLICHIDFNLIIHTARDVVRSRTAYDAEIKTVLIKTSSVDFDAARRIMSCDEVQRTSQ